MCSYQLSVKILHISETHSKGEIISYKKSLIPLGQEKSQKYSFSQSQMMSLRVTALWLMLGSHLFIMSCTIKASMDLIQCVFVPKQGFCFSTKSGMPCSISSNNLLKDKLDQSVFNPLNGCYLDNCFFQLQMSVGPSILLCARLCKVNSLVSIKAQ